MKVSSRNQFSGVVKEVVKGAVNAEIHVQLDGGEMLIASITNDSVAALHLAKGIQVIALIKAPQITIVTDFGGYKLSARNQLQGIVSQVKTGVINAEIILTIKGGDQIAVTVTKDSVQTLNLHEGQIATAVFKAGVVILAVAS